MRKPKKGKKYILVRVNGDHIEHAEYTRFDDDSVFIVAEGYVTSIDFSPGAWEQVWADLENRGFVELRQARDSGLVSAEWLPTR